MTDFLFVAAILVLITLALSLWRVLRGPAKADRMMAAQLLGTGGIAILLLAAGSGLKAAADVALTLALLSALAAVAFVKSGERLSSRAKNENEP